MNQIETPEPINNILQLQQYIEEENSDELRKFQPENFQESDTNTGDTALHFAVKSKKKISVGVIHKHCHKLVHQKNTDGQTPLHLAASKGYWEIVKILMYTCVRGEEHDIESGQDEYIVDNELLRMSDKGSDTALHLAVSNDHIEVVKLLTEAYPDYQYEKNCNQEYPLDIALKKRFLGVVKQITEACVHSECVTSDSLKSGCLHWIETQDIDALKVIFDKYPSELYNIYYEGKSGLHIAAGKGHSHTELAKFLMCFHTDQEIRTNGTVKRSPNWELLKMRTDTGNNALHCAVEGGQDEFAKLFWHYSSDSCFENNLKGNTGLHLAAQHDRLSIVEFYFNDALGGGYGYSLLQSSNKDGKTALHMAAEKKHEMVAVYLHQRLVECGFVIAATLLDNQKNTILHSAIIGNATMLVQHILTNDSDEKPVLGIRNNEKNTALHLAVKNNCNELVELLTSADREYRYSANSEGLTPLYIAVKKQNYSLVRTIISACPSSSYAAPNLDTALIRAVMITDTENHTAKLLLGNQPKQCKVRNGDGWTALHKAAEYGNLTIIKEMVRLCPGYLEDVTYNDGRNFLHLAAAFGHVEVVKYIMETPEIPSAVLNQKDHEGNTPLHAAVTSGNKELIERLLYDDKVNKNIKNKQGKTATELIKFLYDKKKAGAYDREKVDDKELKDRREFELVVSALIATVSFTAGITVPGGFNSDKPHKGMAVLTKLASFDAFVMSNTCALVLSLSAVFSHFCTRLLKKKKDIDLQATLATMYTLGAIFAMMVSFITGSYAVLSVSRGLAITLCVISCTFFISAFYPILLLAIHYKRQWWPR